ncbi:aldehyde dehydrogenase family protein [Spelaeicoccus albus]|uniref:Aldehyde dehydrogenase (NAD+) n=1 Tax=Spelaeicoccus albus TaxID=1280376 RepID=A0A7Z0D2J3_9MICO|nr:aldehyde dehydrogenase family protein [Spelaeicoccus albus]NYI67691.1 aldehyde dehydrogenase (NAD+) [Spelaeicoccus albus]
MTTANAHIASIVNGAQADAGAKEFVSRNPARTSDVVATVSLSGPDTLVNAARVARTAQRTWAEVPAPVRGTVIAAFSRLMKANKERLARIVTREIGKPYAESLGEVQEVIDTADYFLGEGRRLYGQTVPSEMPDKQLFTFRVPVGVATIVTAGNFPVAVPSWYIVPALVTGNAIVWKPAEYAAECARAFTEIAWRAGVPKDVLQLVYADGNDTYAGLEAALDAGLVDKIGFTGSSVVGHAIGELAGRHLQVPCLELGGKNPQVVAPDADLDLAVDGALFGGFGTAGQRCTSLGTLIVHRSVYDEFVAKFRTAVEDAVIGDPTEGVLYGPMLDQKFADHFEDILGWIQPHHTVIGSTGTGRITADNPRANFVGDPDEGVFYHPVILTGVRQDDAVFTEETFGPLVGVVAYDDFDEAIALANRSGYGLSASVYTNDPATAFRFRSGVSAGMVSVNNSTSGAEAHLPFGGNGRSGNGSRQSGLWVLDQFTKWQSMNWDFSGTLQKAQMDVVPTIGPELDYLLPE